MAGLIAAAAVASGASGDIDARIGEAARAEQALSGPLEGSWTLRDAAGRPLMDLQIADPVDGRPGGAWRALRDGGGSGVIEGGSRGGHVVQLRLSGEAGWLILRPQSRDLWRGRLIIAGHAREVTLGR